MKRSYITPLIAVIIANYPESICVSTPNNSLSRWWWCLSDESDARKCGLAVSPAEIVPADRASWYRTHESTRKNSIFRRISSRPSPSSLPYIPPPWNITSYEMTRSCCQHPSRAISYRLPWLENKSVELTLSLEQKCVHNSIQPFRPL